MLKIRWTCAERIQLTHSQIEDLICDFRKKNIRELPGEKPTTKAKDWIDYINHTGAFSINRRKLVVDDPDPLKREGMIEVFYCNGEQDRIIYWATKQTDKEIKMQQIRAGSKIKERFELCEGGKRMRDAFGVVNSKEYQALVPKPTYYINPAFTYKNIENVKCIDVTSLYPWAIAGKMPTTKGMITLEGRVKPNEEYPFAFYLKSNHVAEYNRFDTHDYFDLTKTPIELRNWLIASKRGNKKLMRFNMIPDDRDVTVLMKASKWEMTRTFLSFYEDKEKYNYDKECIEYQTAKFIMNAGIGTLHKSPYRRKVESINDYYHIAAITLGRANQKMIETFNQIKEEGNIPLQVVVDGISYIELEKDNIGTKEKILGEFNIEAENAIYRSNGILNRYVIADNDLNIIKQRVSGYDVKLDSIYDIDKYNKDFKGEIDDEN